MRSAIISSVVALSGTALLVACSSAPPDTGETDQGVKGTSTSSSSSSSSGSTSGSSAPKLDAGPTPDATSASSDGASAVPAACAGKQGNACFQCCQDAFPKALSVLSQAYMTCLCGSPCKAECGGNLCAGQQQPSDACEQCDAQKGDVCFQAAEKAAQGNADATAYLACENACAQTAPEPSGSGSGGGGGGS